MSRWFLILASAVALAGCATTSSLQSREPSYVATYDPVDHEELKDCVHAKIIKQSGYGSVLNTGTDGDHSFIVQPLIGLYGPQGTSWVANFYTERTEIFGTASIRGDQGKYILPFIDECLENQSRS
jgi:hypothetical protein